MLTQNGQVRTINGTTYTLKPRDYVVILAHDAVATSVVTGVINIDPSSPFILTGFSMGDSLDPQLVAPGMEGQYENSIQIQDTSNGYNWSNDFVPRSAFAGSRHQGKTLSSEITIKENTRFTVTLRNPALLPAAGATTVVFRGYSLY